MRLKFKRLLLTTLVFALIPFAASAQTAQATPEQTLSVTFGIQYIENVAVNTYNMTVLMDDLELFSMSQGENRIFTLTLPKGKHQFSIIGQNKDKSSDSITLDLSEDTCFSVECKAKWMGLTIVRFDVTSGEEATQLIKDSSLLGTVRDQVIEWIDQIPR